MTRWRLITLIAAIVSLLAILSVSAFAGDHAEEGAKPLTVYLVRHAEKQKGDDPSLTKAGEARAVALGERLKDAGIEHVHTTPYKRTRETAGLASRQLDGIDIIKGYDPRKLAEFAQSLIDEGGTHLVVGHSNTTPQLVTLLGGDPDEGMTEKTYDRLYMVLVSGQGNVTTLNLQYGAASQ